MRCKYVIFADEEPQAEPSEIGDEMLGLVAIQITKRD